MICRVWLKTGWRWFPMNKTRWPLMALLNIVCLFVWYLVVLSLNSLSSGMHSLLLFCNHYGHRWSLCRADCLAVRDLFCQREWTELVTSKVHGRFLKSRHHFRLPSCAGLPSQSDVPCSSAHLFDISPAMITSELPNVMQSSVRSVWCVGIVSYMSHLYSTTSWAATRGSLSKNPWIWNA